MVTAPEATALLAIAAGFDNRKPDRDTVRAWTEALAEVDYDDARTVIISHYKTSTDWIMPAHVVTGVRQIQAERLANSPNVYELEPPPHVTDLDGEAFDAAYLSWIQDTTRRIRRGEPYETGQRPPAVEDPARLRELVAAVNVAHRAS